MHEPCAALHVISVTLRALVTAVAEGGQRTSGRRAAFVTCMMLLQSLRLKRVIVTVLMGPMSFQTVSVTLTVSLVPLNVVSVDPSVMSAFRTLP